MRRVLQCLKPPVQAESAVAPTLSAATSIAVPSQSAKASAARRTRPLRASASHASSSGQRLKSSWQALTKQLSDAINAPEQHADPFIGLEQWMPPDPSDAQRAARREQAKELQSTVKQWYLDAGLSKSKADLQALTWRGEYKRSPETQFSAESANTFCNLLDTLATYRAELPSADGAALSKRVASLMGEMVVDPALRAQCFQIADDGLAAGGAHVAQVLELMERQAGLT